MIPRMNMSTFLTICYQIILTVIIIAILILSILSIPILSKYMHVTKKHLSLHVFRTGNSQVWIGTMCSHRMRKYQSHYDLLPITVL